MKIKFMRNQKQLSKFISLVLRHEPWLYELELDEQGWVFLGELLDVIHRSKPEWKSITEKDISKMLEQSEKKRHEIKNGKIRALYGHSIPGKIKKEITEPPELLYHGTSTEVILKIKKNGLLPMRRHYVHLSTDKETALQVGKRKSDRPSILTIRAKEAFNHGVKFYWGNEIVWLADFIPKEFIIFN